MLSRNRLLSMRENFPGVPNRWDWFALVFVLSILITLTAGVRQMSAPFHLGEVLPISLDPAYLPHYALQTLLRMVIALIGSLLFTFIFATWAAKSKQAEKVIIPIIDILQSVPVLAFLSITIVGFIALFPNSLLGPQCAVIFVIFTAQAWNMALSFYQSLRTLPVEFREAAEIFQLSAWQRFWRLDVPFAMPGLLWNAMMSMSASWFALVASEAISIGNQQILLPGIGSYIGKAILEANLSAVGYAILAMLVAILLYDQLLFRPMVKWAEKFKAEHSASEKVPHSWVMDLLERTRVFRYLGYWIERGADALVNLSFFQRKHRALREEESHSWITQGLEWAWNILIVVALIRAFYVLEQFIFSYLSWTEFFYVANLGLMTAIRVFSVVVICSIIWVPVGVWIGLRPRVAEVVQPLAQFLAAFPANLLFPLVVILIVRYQLNVEIWTTPLMALGAQWYILFNVIAGTTAIPKDLKQVAENFGLSRVLWWRRLILPGIFPYYITGAITAVGGAWNASIVAEVVTWGNTTLRASGLGAYVAQNTGSFPKIALGVSMMCLFVLVLNRLFWRPLYRIAQNRFKLD